MDRLTRTANIIKSYYSYKKNSDAATFVKEVCGFFDFIKNEPISEADMNFLIFLANEAGIPQYFDLFKDKFTDCRISDENIKTLTISALFHDASLIRGNSKLHRYQKNVLDSFKIGQQNRFVLTAPTSFGKTFLVYEIIQKMQYQNVLLIFPAISLLSENYARLCKLDIFQSYKIHSLSEEEFSLSERNIFIFTPERFLSFMDSHQHIHFDFAFIDEVYKIDNSFIIDPETSGENERDTAYRLALEFICNLTSDMLLAGPYMALPQSDTQQHKSFNNFAEDNGFCFLRYNQFEIVSKEYITVKGKRQYHIDEIPVEIGSISKGQKIANIIKVLSTPKEYWPGFQAIMDIILPVVREEKLKQLIVIRVGQNQYSLITNLLSSYLSGGFLSMVQYYVGRKDNPKTKDEAMRQVADFVYNVFKYHLVKYLGLFDVFFRYQISKSENISMEDVAGLGLLLQKLEYNALSPNARKVSDYGVPFKLIDCYDSKTPYDKGQFDAYEQHIDQEINRLFQ